MNLPPVEHRICSACGKLKQVDHFRPRGLKCLWCQKLDASRRRNDLYWGDENYRARVLASGRALTRLRRSFATEFATLLEEELLRARHSSSKNAAES